VFAASIMMFQEVIISRLLENKIQGSIIDRGADEV